MKKLFFCIILMFFIQIAVYAQPEYEQIMSDRINNLGIFNGKSGIVYADTKNFEGNNSLFIVSISDKSINCEIYDKSDGIQLTDKIEFPKKTNCRLSCGKNGDNDVFILSSKNSKEVYTLLDDTITKSDNTKITEINDIAGYSNGKPVSYTSRKNISSFVTSLKEDTLSQYPFQNIINTLSDTEINDIKETLAACVDIMSFDIKDYDYDKLFKYILYTHKNFSILTDIPANSGQSSSLGYNNVSIVNSEFIDYIMEQVFRITPEKPPVNNLLERGFCYNNGYYFYSGGFDVYFSTEIRDIISVYDLGSGVMFVVFSDIYTEGDTKTQEYSFAVLQKNDEGYSLLRLGMGEPLPSEHEVTQYSPFSHTNNNQSATSDKTESSNIQPIPYILLIIAVGIVGLICGIYILIKNKK